MTFMLADWTLYAMWFVLGMMGLDFLVGLYRSLKTKSLSHTLILGYLLDTLQYVLPLFILANMEALDHTGYLLSSAYYLGALGVVLKYAASLKMKLK